MHISNSLHIIANLTQKVAASFTVLSAIRHPIQYIWDGNPIDKDIIFMTASFLNLFQFPRSANMFIEYESMEMENQFNERQKHATI